MKSKISPWTPFACLAIASMILCTSCGGGSDTGDTDGTDSTATTDNKGDGANDANPGPAPGEIPFDFPVVATTSAKAGEQVLAPSRAFIDKAFEKEGKSGFTFYNATVIKPGTDASTLKQVVTEASIPNSVIIPIGTGATAAKGDVVLSWWQSGSGMQRCYVVDDANGATPGVKYLDLTLDNPAKNKAGVPIGQMTEQLKENTFVPLTDPWQPGTACYEKTSKKWGIIISVAGGKVLTRGFAGMMAVFDQANAVAIPPIPDVSAGDAVLATNLGKMTEGTVKKVDDGIGRVYVEIQFGGQPKEIPAPFGDVIAAE